MYFQIIFFCENCKESKPGLCFTYVHALNNIEQIGISILYLQIFLITIHEIDTAAEVYLEPFKHV